MQCIKMEEFECAGTSLLLPAEEDESFSTTDDLLSVYIKKATETVTVKNVANTAVPPTLPLPLSPAGAGAVAPTAVKQGD